MSIIMGVDPGPEESAYVWLEIGDFDTPLLEIAEAAIVKNRTIKRHIKRVFRPREVGFLDYVASNSRLVIESVESYGMAVGKTVFETCYWIGRFDPTCRAKLLPRRDVKLHLCGSARAKDGNIRQALIDRFGPGDEKAIGGVKCPKCKGKGWFGAGRPDCPECKGIKWKHPPGPLYSISTPLWSALALAVTFHDLGKERWTNDETTTSNENR